MIIYGLLKERSRRCFIAFLGEQEVNRIARFINGAL
jgi:hypothetical protein